MKESISDIAKQPSIQLLIRNLPDYAYLKDTQGRYILANHYAPDVLGIEVADIYGKTDFDFYPTERAEQFQAEEQHILQTGEPLFRQKIQITNLKSNHKSDLIISKVPFRAEDGQIIGILVTGELIASLLQSANLEQRTWIDRYQAIMQLISDYAYGYTIFPSGERTDFWMTEDSLKQVTGYGIDEIRGTYLLYHPDDVERAKQDVARTFEGHPQHGEYRIITKDGQLRWVYIRRKVEYLPDNPQAMRFYGVAQDITIRKLAQETVNQSQQRLSLLVQQSPLAVIEWDANKNITEWNPAAETIFEYSREEALGKNGIELLVQPQHQDEINQYFKNMVDDHIFVTSTNENITQNGNIVICRWYNIPLIDAMGDVIGFASIAQDMTEQIQAEQNLQETLQRYQIIAELISDYAYSYRIEPNGEFIKEWRTEEPFERLTGFTQELMDTSTFQLYHPDDVELARQHVAATLQGQETASEYRIVTRDGEVRWIYLSRRVEWDEKHNRPIRFYGVAQDITKRKLAEAALRQSEERYRIVSEMISDYAFSYKVDIDGTVTYEWVTDSFYRLTGFNPQEIGTSERRYTLYIPEDDKLAQEHVQKMIKENVPVSGEYRIYTRAGELRWLQIYRQPVWGEEEQRVVRFYGIAQDITERKLAEAALRRSEARYRAIIEDQTEFVIRWQPDGTRTFVNQAYARYYDARPEDLIGTSFLSVIVPEDHVILLEKLTRLSPQNPIEGDIHRSIKPDGNTAWHEWSDRGIFDKDGQLIEIQSVGRDITERVLAENTRIEMAVQKERLELLEELIGDISHDIKTPISSINTYLYLLKKQPSPEKQEHYINILEEQVDHLTRLVEDILLMSRLDKSEKVSFESVNLEYLIADVGRSFHMMAEAKSIQLVLDLDSSLPPVQGDKLDLGRAVTNLLQNAIHYTPFGGLVTVSTFRKSDNAVIVVEDTGIGIQEKDIPMIFDRFFRSDKARNTNTGGTGLGLAIVKKIIEVHNGTIEVQSTPDVGTKFIISIPIG